MKFLDRDLSWLSFNYRVLLEAQSNEVPLLERLRFLAIYSSNLDEFVRVRVADIRNLVQIDKEKINKRISFSPKKLLKTIHLEVNRQLKIYSETLLEVCQKLEAKNITICRQLDTIPSELKPDLLHHFKSKVAPFLKPKYVDMDSDIFMDNKAVYFAIQFESKEFAYLKIPSDKIPRFFIKSINGVTYCVFLDDIIRLHFDLVFPAHNIRSEGTIKVNKDADLLIDDEYEGNLVAKIEKQIAKRNLGIPSRFLYDGQLNDELLHFFSSRLELSEGDIVEGGRYHNLNDFFQITSLDESLAYGDLPAIKSPSISHARSLYEQISKQDCLLHFPYHSYDHIIQFFGEAALNPSVTEINVTFYRLAKNSLIGEALISAAKNGKQVNIFMEVKARFDEENNLKWAKKLKKAGAKVVYSLPGLKVHAKVALIKTGNGAFAFLGTGNLNESTAKIYTDHGLLTANEELTDELSQVFDFLNEQIQPTAFDHLIVSQFGALEKFESLIERETNFAKDGKEALIIIKLNNLQEPRLITKLYEAAENGVEVRCIVRSICCLVPGKNGIKVKRIIDRFLEHGRLFYFKNGGKEEVYLGSTDWMNRNLHRRIEVTFPMYDPKMKTQFKDILNLQWGDDVKGVWLDKKLTNQHVDTNNGIQAQIDIYDYIKKLH